MEAENSNVLRAEEIKVQANDAFKGADIYFCISHPFFNPFMSMLHPLFCQILCIHSCLFCPLLSARKYALAIDLYTRAIELNNDNAVYWANRAFAHTKLEEYGSAIQDASKAIEIDPKYSKVCHVYLNLCVSKTIMSVCLISL